MTDWYRILQDKKPISVEYNINPPNFMQMNEALCFILKGLIGLKSS